MVPNSLEIRHPFSHAVPHLASDSSPLATFVVFDLRGCFNAARALSIIPNGDHGLDHGFLIPHTQLDLGLWQALVRHPLEPSSEGHLIPSSATVSQMSHVCRLSS